MAIGRARKKKRLRLIDFHPRNVTKPDKSLFEFYEQSSVDFLCDLECCSISYSVDIDLKFDFEEHVSSESELSEFSFEDINEIDKLVVVHGNVACSVTADPVPPENDANLTNCPITLNDIKSCIPDTLVTDEQKLVSDKINLMLEKYETGLRMFVTKLFEKISAIYE